MQAKQGSALIVHFPCLKCGWFDLTYTTVAIFVMIIIVTILFLNICNIQAYLPLQITFNLSILPYFNLGIYYQ